MILDQLDVRATVLPRRSGTSASINSEGVVLLGGGKVSDGIREKRIQVSSQITRVVNTSLTRTNGQLALLNSCSGLVFEGGRICQIGQGSRGNWTDLCTDGVDLLGDEVSCS